MSIHIALAKGRIHKVVMKYLMESGYEFPSYSEDSRKLIFEDAGHTLKLTLVKSPDVAVYVERGAADIGIGRCNMAVAGVKGKKVDMSRRITVGTKYPRIARKYFEENHHSVDIIKLNGSVELAPLVGLSDVIVDIVETGNTLRANGLEVLDYFMDFSARMICNPVSFKMKYDEIHTLIDVIKKKEIR